MCRQGPFVFGCLFSSRSGGSVATEGPCHGETRSSWNRREIRCEVRLAQRGSSRPRRAAAARCHPPRFVPCFPGCPRSRWLASHARDLGGSSAPPPGMTQWTSLAYRQRLTTRTSMSLTTPLPQKRIPTNLHYSHAASWAYVHTDRHPGLSRTPSPAKAEAHFSAGTRSRPTPWMRFWTSPGTGFHSTIAIPNQPSADAPHRLRLHRMPRPTPAGVIESPVYERASTYDDDDRERSGRVTKRLRAFSRRSSCSSVTSKRRRSRSCRDTLPSLA